MTFALLGSPLIVSLWGRVPGVLEYIYLNEDERRGLKKTLGGLMPASSTSFLGRAQAGGRRRSGIGGGGSKNPPQWLRTRRPQWKDSSPEQLRATVTKLRCFCRICLTKVL